MSLRRMLPFILVNIAVSATVVIGVLLWWDARQPNGGEPAVAALPAATNVSPMQVTSVANVASTETPVEAEAEEDGPPIHIVQAGETLGSIGQLYDVPVEEIAAANDIVNVNSISVGQELLIPLPGYMTPTAPATPTAAQTATPLATEPPPAGTAVVEITEVIGAGELTSEAVRISNTGTRPIPLRDWELSDEDGHVFVFVDVTLFGGTDSGAPSILVHTEAGQNGPSDLYWGSEEALWSAGETVTLRDAEGTEQATFVVP